MLALAPPWCWGPLALPVTPEAPTPVSPPAWEREVGDGGVGGEGGGQRGGRPEAASHPEAAPPLLVARGWLPASRPAAAWPQGSHRPVPPAKPDAPPGALRGRSSLPSCGRNWRSSFPPSSGDQKPESGCGVGHAPPHSPCPPPAPTGSRSPWASPWVVAAPTLAPAASAPGLPPTALRPPTRTPVTWAGAAPGALAGPLPLRCPCCRTVAFRGAGVRASASVLDSQLSLRHLPAGVVLAAVWPSAGRLWWGEGRPCPGTVPGPPRAAAPGGVWGHCFPGTVCRCDRILAAQEFTFRE